MILFPVPPSFQKAPADRYASIGEEVTLECYAIGTPPLHIFWWKEGAGVRDLIISNVRGVVPVKWSDGSTRVCNNYVTDHGITKS